jgi:hypothetical protein
MNKIRSNYWDKEIKIPFKYRKVKNIVKALLRQVEKDRDEGVSMTPVSIDYNIKYKYLIFECLEKYFELRLISVPVSHKLGLYKQPIFCLVDIKSREKAWYDKCLLNPAKAIDLIAYRIKNCLDNCLDCLSHVDTSDICYCVNVPEHIFTNAFDKIKSNTYLRDATYQTFINDGYTYYYVNIIECYEKAKEPVSPVSPKVSSVEITTKIVNETEAREKFTRCISNLIYEFEKAYNDDRNFLGQTKSEKPTIIECEENLLKFNEDEIKLITTLMFRKGYEFSCKYNNEKKLIISISSLNNKEKRLKNLETMMGLARLYGFGVEKLDLSSIKDLTDNNIVRRPTEWVGACFNTVIGKLSRSYEGYLDL